MSRAPTTVSGLVRVTVTSDSRRVDLALPAAVPVAELLPELARNVGLLDGRTVHEGYRLLTHEGRELSAEAGLAVQGVGDGGLLSVCPGVAVEAPRVYDDVVEAMGDVVARDVRGWSQPAGRRAALGSAALLLVLGVLGLLLQGGSAAATATGLLAAGLVTAAVLLSRTRDEPEVAVVVAWLGCGSAAAAGLLLAPEARLLLPPVSWAGAGSLLAGVVGLVGLGAGRPLLIPPVVVGAVLLATGGVQRVAAVDPGVALTTLLVFLVVAGSSFPSLALQAAGSYSRQLLPAGDPGGEVAPVDVDRVGADARAAREILVGIQGTVGLLLVLVAPYAVVLGRWGALTVVTCCLVVVLRTRRHRGGVEVCVGLVSGVLGLATTAAAALWSQPGWRAPAAASMLAAGVVLLAVAVRPGPPSLRRRWLVGVAETALLVVLPPLLVLAVGVVDLVRG